MAFHMLAYLDSFAEPDSLLDGDEGAPPDATDTGSGVKDVPNHEVWLALPACHECAAEGRDGGADTLPPLGLNAARVHRQRGVFGGTDDSAGPDAHGAA